MADGKKGLIQSNEKEECPLIWQITSVGSPITAAAAATSAATATTLATTAEVDSCGDDKGKEKVDDKGKGKVDDLQNKVDRLEKRKAKLMISEKGTKKANVDLVDTLDLQNRIKKLSGDFNRLLKAKKVKET
ncbi:hypothetical protein Tco_0926216 [Tanacetum coccineum]|uniref:Uncharacterized protein n=1 Tax=Tanacetum coccineum TaxID=301880 RepID=A0ABQ5DAB9_9ASTR